jgi:hypothetical protein
MFVMHDGSVGLLPLVLGLLLGCRISTTDAGCVDADDGDAFDVVVVGSGAAGLQAAWYLQKETNLKAAVLEKGNDVGHFWQTFPRGGELISFNKRFNLYGDPEVKLCTRLTWLVPCYACITVGFGVRSPCGGTGTRC